MEVRSDHDLGGRADAPLARRELVVSVVFYGAIAVTMLLIWTETLSSVLPSSLARRVSFNSEGLFFAGVLAAWIHVITKRHGRPRLDDMAVAATAACFVVGVALAATDLPSRFKTLSESFLALAFAVPYLTVRRPIARIGLALPTIAIVAFAVVSTAIGEWDFFVQQAELLGIVLLLPIALDIIDPAILRPGAVTSRWLRYGWYGVLVAEVVVVSAAGTDIRDGETWYAGSFDVLGRSHYAVIGVLALQLFFAVGLQRRGVERTA
ncbi:MAG: hypothetical protein AB8G26_02350 [Ilumatobacter sp.]